MYPDHVKALCDGAFYSQLMQMAGSYMDGHDGQIHVHTNGDLGMKTLLDIVEKLINESPREKHRTEHAGYFTEEQLGS